MRHFFVDEKLNDEVSHNTLSALAQSFDELSIFKPMLRLNEMLSSMKLANFNFKFHDAFMTFLTANSLKLL